MNCPKRVKSSPLPPSFPLEAARSHPRFRYYLEPGAQCEHEEGHDGPHRNGLLVWHDPPAVFVGGERIE
jgi:hypothetical protein